jgi:SAM-dependent methyltransferase
VDGAVDRRWERQAARADDGSLAEAWEANAAEWIAWARTPGHDVYEQFHRDALFHLLPAPGRATLDLGCGEGRVARDLTAAGHHVVGLDHSATLAAAATSHPSATAVALGDAAELGIGDATVDLVVAFMSLQDVDRPAKSLAEIARVLEPGGRAVVAVVHPLNGSGVFAGPRTDHEAPFVIEGSYLAPRRYVDDVERDGLRMGFVSDHRSIEDWSRLIEAAGLLVEAVREVGSPAPTDRWHRIPLFLHLRLLRP